MKQPTSECTTQVIALTGGIGSGKSTVMQWLKAWGVPTLNADEVARDLVEPGAPAYDEMVQHFGKEICLPDGQLNRALLREKIFQNPSEKRWLEALLHPLIRQTLQQRVEAIKQQTPPPSKIVIEIPLLAETGKPDFIDQVWVVDCEPDTQLKRASQRDGQTPDAIHKIIQQQANRQNRLAMADEVLNSEQTLDQLKQQVQTLIC
jgi:dephospho-CoA kinase